MNGRGSVWARWFAVLAAITVFTVTGGGLAGSASADPGRGQAQASSAPQQSNGWTHASKAGTSRHSKSAVKTAEKRRPGASTPKPRASSSTSATAASAERGNSPSDPDGMENGGADKPGGQGGTIGAQDGNNGSGNDIDCEDDNRGQGVPGHCKAKSWDAGCLPGKGPANRHGHSNGHAHGKRETARTTCSITPSESSQPDNSSPTTATPAIPAADDTGDTATGSNASPSTTAGTAPLVDASPLEASSPTAEVLGVEASRPTTRTLAGAEVAGVSAAATFTSPTAGVLPNTGAGKALGLFLLIGVVAVGLGAWMLTKRWGLAFKQV